MGILYAIVIGAIAGWLAGQLMKGGGFGLLWNIVIGIIGGVIGSWLLVQLGFSIGTGIAWLNDVLTGLIGAIVLLFLASLVKKMT
jgi:uncharacterized membrane protein YeaQ/YmgE (transglycosylase-associated protein family)